MDAVVPSMTTDTAIERPRPNFEPLAPPDSAFVVETESGSAMSETSPEPPASATVAPFPIDAVLDASTRLNASEPAIEFFPPPAPEVASAPNVFAESEPTVCVRDSRVSDPALIVAPFPIEASVVRKARFTPTAAPMVFALVPPVAATA